jgi:hypothetical protein
MTLFEGHPPAFACHRDDPFAQEGIVTFTSCNVLTDGMNPATGIFTVKKEGIYQLSFTGLFQILNGHQVTISLIFRGMLLASGNHLFGTWVPSKSKLYLFPYPQIVPPSKNVPKLYFRKIKLQ